MSITLKAARVNAGLTQSQMAKALGVSEVTIRSYEQGKTFPDVRQIQIIEDLTGIPVSDIRFAKNVRINRRMEA